MKRSSRLALALALACLLAAAVLYGRSLDSAAPRITAASAEAFLQSGRAALERRDVNAVLALVAEDASLFGKTPGDLRRALHRALRDTAGSKPTAVWSDLSVEDRGDTATISFDMSVGERGAAMTATYYEGRVTLRLAKRKLTHWLGLYHTEVWRVVNAESSGDVTIPEF